MIKEFLIFLFCVVGLLSSGYLWMDYGLRGEKNSGYSLIGGVGFAIFCFCIVGILFAFQDLVYAIYIR